MKQFFAFLILSIILLSSCQADPNSKIPENINNTINSAISETEQMNEKKQSDQETDVTANQELSDHLKLWDIEGNDLEGNTVNLKEHISGHALTLINFWGTYCGPCKVELPDLAKIANDYQDHDISVLAIAIDVTEDQPSQIDLAKDILAEEEDEFTCVMNNEKLNQTVVGNIFAVPTSLLLDAQGNIIGDPIIGAQSYDFFADLFESNLK